MSASVLQSAPDRGEPPVVRELVTAKVTVPSLRAGALHRDELVRRLESAASARLVLLSAPAGYGKTMLAAAWSARTDRIVAWLSLSPAENDPALMTSYVMQALRVAGIAVGPRAERLSQVPGANPEGWTSVLANDLHACAATIGVTLVLDDFHVITAPACHAIVGGLLDHAPPSVNLLVATRADPPLGTGALRAAGRLAEFREADLRYTRQEAAEVVASEPDVDLDDGAVARLTERTEGWPAGLYLATLWLRAGRTDSADVERFAGDNRHVVDYLREVVLDRLDPGTRETLLSTSIVDRVSPSLAEALMGRPMTDELSVIERENLFLVPLDQTRTWFRYHHLFGTMLRGELARRHPERVPELHRRAGAWHLAEGLIAAGVEHAALAGDVDAAAELISRHWLDTVHVGQIATVRRWITAFGPEDLERHPELGVIMAFIVGMTGGLEAEFRPWLELAERGLARDPGRQRPVAGTTSLALGVDMLVAIFGYRDIPAAVAATAEAVRHETRSGGAFRLAGTANLGLLLYFSGDPQAARQVLSEIRRDPRAMGSPFGYISALSVLALIALDEGNADAAERVAREALELAQSLGLDVNPIAGLAHVALGRSLLAGGHLALAGTEVERGVHLLQGSMLAGWRIYALLWAAPVRARLGQTAEAFRLLEEAEAMLERFDDAAMLVARAGDVRRQLERAQTRRGAGAAALSDAELRVLRCLRGSRTHREIADDLALSMNTVKSHVTRIHRKLGVASREAAVARGTELGLLG